MNLELRQNRAHGTSPGRILHFSDYFRGGVCVVDPRLVFLEPEKEWKWFVVVDEEIQKPE